MTCLFPFDHAVLPEGGTITILGSTGSIGKNTLAVFDILKEKSSRSFHIKSLCAHKDYKTLAQQACTYHPDYIALYDTHYYKDLKALLGGYSGTILMGEEGVLELASQKSDYVMSSIVGVAGLKPTLCAAQKGTVIALANKECVVSGGALFLNEIRRKGAYLFPVDSEHNALYHLLSHMPKEQIAHYYITASGGALRDLPLDQMDHVTKADVLKHPNWSMGAKISVDSATMFNKGLELIEACILFGLRPDQCDALLHPQSKVHAMISNTQGEMHFLASQPDMKIPIFSSLSFGNKDKMDQYFDVKNSFSLDFSQINSERYPLFDIAKKALQMGQGAPLMINAANEVAVEAFLQEKISYLNMQKLVKKIFENIQDIYYKKGESLSNIEDIFILDHFIRQETKNIIYSGLYGISS